MLEFRHAARAFARTRWLQWTLRTRDDVRRYQRGRLARLEQCVERDIPFYRDLSARGFANWPIIDKAALLSDFARFNRASLELDEVRAILAAGGSAVRGQVVGHSTGTSGNRGYFVIGNAERFVWLGTILAKTLPDALWRRHRVALALPGFPSLYRSASSGSRINLRFFDLADGVDAWADEMRQFAPDTIVAPPKVLRLLAERNMLTARTIFSCAEVLDPIDRAQIEAATGQMVREIYMATEGLFGVSCTHGTLHLAEDNVHFEWEDAAPDSALKMPIVSDFTRRAQAMARYRMNDLIELDERPCPCGSPLQPVRRIVGRRDDMFLLAARDGGLRHVTPDVLRNAMVQADRRIQDFRIVQTGASAIAVTLDAQLPRECGEAVQSTIDAMAARLGLRPVVLTLSYGIAIPFDGKLRRVVRQWQSD